MSTSSVSGLTSGIDWQSTIDSLMEIEGNKVTLLENRQAKEQEALNAWRQINTKLLSLESASAELTDLDDLLAYRSASSDEDIVGATANAGSVEGTYSIEVNRLATASRATHGGWADLNTTAVNSSGSTQQFVYTYGTGEDQETITLNVANGATLAELKQLINNDSDNPGVRATIINDGSGEDTAYHLVLTSTSTGSSSEIVIESETTLDGFDESGFSQITAGQNAQIRVDGYPPTGWIESDSNEVSDVLEGVTLELNDTSNGDIVQISITRDNATVKERIQGWVDAYNEVLSLIDTYDSYDLENEKAGALFGDSGTRSLKNRLLRSATRPIEGLSEGFQFSSLSEVGISLGESGTLEIDSSKLDDVLAESFEDFGQLFTLTSSSNNEALSYFSHNDRTAGGEYAVDLTYDAEGNITAASIDGTAATIDGSFIIGADDTNAEGLRLYFKHPGDEGTINVLVNLGLGIAPLHESLSSRLTDDEEGTVQFQVERLEESISNFDDQIEDMERRLEATRAALEQQYISMETTLATLQSQADYLSQL